MGGERASTTRARLAGAICCRCRLTLPPPWPGRERFCVRCDPASHRVLMTFFLARGWLVQFTEADCRTPIGRIHTYPDTAEATVRTLAERGLGLATAEARHAFAVDLERGRGSAWLTLTAEQYGKLQHG